MKTLMVVNQSYDEYEARERIKKGKLIIFLGFVIILVGFVVGYYFYNGYVIALPVLIGVVGVLVIYVGFTIIEVNKKRLKKALVKKVEISQKKQKLY